MTQPPTGERPDVALAEQHELDRNEEPRIYVASLADYNAGHLHGAWINANQDVDDLAQEIARMLARSRQPEAEEWAIHDYEGFGPLHLSEYESIERISALARGIVEHGRAFAHWADYLGADPDNDLAHFEDSYLGQWDSTTDFAESLLDDLGVDLDVLVDEQWRPYVSFDVDAFARDLQFDFYVSEGEDGIYVFDTI